MSSIFIPTLSHWQLGNTWSGSFGKASYYVTPRKREEGDEKIPELFVEVWTGPVCYEMSTAERTNTFPVTEEGLAEMHAWLEGQLTVLDQAAQN